MIDKRHTLRFTSDDANALVVLYAEWPGGVALLEGSATEVSVTNTPTRIVIPLRRNQSVSRRAAAEANLLGPHGLPLGEVYVVALERAGSSSVGIFAVPRGVSLDLRVESLATCDQERAQRMPPRA